MSHNEGTISEQRGTAVDSPVTPEFEVFAQSTKVEATLAVEYCNFLKTPELCAQNFNMKWVKRSLEKGWVNIENLTTQDDYFRFSEIGYDNLGRVLFVSNPYRLEYIAMQTWDNKALRGSAVEVAVFGKSDWQQLYVADLEIIEVPGHPTPQLGFNLLEGLKGKLKPDPQGYWLRIYVAFNLPTIESHLAAGANRQLTTVHLPVEIEHHPEELVDGVETKAVTAPYGQDYSWRWHNTLNRPVVFSGLTYSFANIAGLLNQADPALAAEQARANEIIAAQQAKEAEATAKRNAYYATYTDELGLESLIDRASTTRERLSDRAASCRDYAADFNREMQSAKPWGGNVLRQSNEIDAARKIYLGVDRISEDLARTQKKIAQWYQGFGQAGPNVNPDTLAKLDWASQGYDRLMNAVVRNCEGLRQALLRAQDTNVDTVPKVDAWKELAKELMSGQKSQATSVDQVWQQYNRNIQSYQRQAKRSADRKAAEQAAAYQKKLVEERQRLKAQQPVAKSKAVSTPPAVSSSGATGNCVERSGGMVHPEQHRKTVSTKDTLTYESAQRKSVVNEARNEARRTCRELHGQQLFRMLEADAGSAQCRSLSNSQTNSAQTWECQLEVSFYCGCSKPSASTTR